MIFPLLFELFFFFFYTHTIKQWKDWLYEIFLLDKLQEIFWGLLCSTVLQLPLYQICRTNLLLLYTQLEPSWDKARCGHAVLILNGYNKFLAIWHFPNKRHEKVEDAIWFKNVSNNKMDFARHYPFILTMYVFFSDN